jgi:hypothetical protein
MSCSLNCTDVSDQKLVQACSIYTGSLRQAAGKDLCSKDDVLAGRWVKMYWGSDKECGEGYVSKVVPGKVEDYTCCSSSQQCNAPEAIPPPIKCFETTSNFLAGYCSGKTARFSVCAVSQARADERAAKFAEVRIRKALLVLHLDAPLLIQMCRLQGASTGSLEISPY